MEILLRRARKNDWLYNNAPRYGFQYFVEEETPGGLKYGLNTFTEETDIEVLRSQVVTGKVYVLHEDQYIESVTDLIKRMELYLLD